jgi:hypothetical protein
MFPFWGQYIGAAGATEWLDCTAVGHMDVHSGVDHPQRRGVPPPGVPALPGTGECEVARTSDIAGWYAALQRDVGAATLVYANVYEWGYALDTPVEAGGCAAGNATAFCAARALWDGGFAEAAWGNGDLSKAADWNGSMWLKKGWPVAPGIRLLDPSVEPFRGYILSMLAAQLRETSPAGFCLDRQDHAQAFSARRDDGLAWDAGAPAAWMGASFLDVTRDMVALAHAQGAIAALSIQLPRVDLVGGFDAFLNEDSDDFSNSALNGLLALAKPSAGWRYSAWGTGTYEAFLQQAIVCGMTPLVPWEAGDHTVDAATDPAATAAALAYAPLYSLLVAKRWVLAPFAVELTSASAAADLWVNIFTVAAGVMVPVVHGVAAGVTTVSLAVNLGDDAPSAASAAALYPGGHEAPLALVPGRRGPRSYVFDDVPLERGCVVVLLRWS